MQQRGKGDPFLDHEKRAEIQTAMEALQHKQVFNLLLAEELQADPDLSKQPRVGRLTRDDLTIWSREINPTRSPMEPSVFPLPHHSPGSGMSLSVRSSDCFRKLTNFVF